MRFAELRFDCGTSETRPVLIKPSPDTKQAEWKKKAQTELCVCVFGRYQEDNKSVKAASSLAALLATICQKWWDYNPDSKNVGALRLKTESSDMRILFRLRRSLNVAQKKLERLATPWNVQKTPVCNNTQVNKLICNRWRKGHPRKARPTALWKTTRDSFSRHNRNEF